MHRIFTNKDQIQLGRELDKAFPEGISYEDAAEYWYNPPLSTTMSSLKRVALWCPGNGDTSVIDAICLTLLTFPEELYVFFSSNTDVDDFERKVEGLGRDLPGIHLLSVVGTHEERLKALSDNPPDHIIVYGSDQVCRTVLGHVDPLTPRTVYGSKTSVLVHNDNTDSTKLAELVYLDVTQGGGNGCLNPSILYMRGDQATEEFLEKLQSFYPSEVVERKFLSEAFKRGAEDLLLTSPRGHIIVRRPIESTPEPHTSGIGGGTLMVVNCGREDPVDVMLQEWSQSSQYLSSIGCRRTDPRFYKSGATRIVRFGRMQEPTFRWTHDGVPLVPQTYKLIGEDR